MSRVNTMFYCRLHRLEICGSCALYFRNLNVSHELDDCSEYDDKWAVADQFDREICIMNAPMRKAPFKTSTIVQSFRTSKVSFQVA